VLGLLAGAAAITFVMMFLIVLYALLSQTRFHRRDMAVLHAMGFTRRQLAAVVPWQSLPLAIASIFVGIPLGILLARQQYAAFARRLGVIESPSTPVLIILGIVAVVMLVVAISVALAMLMARRTDPATTLRNG
jgi:ABC-type antimicrobial peptide transport system permease subunit